MDYTRVLVECTECSHREYRDNYDPLTGLDLLEWSGTIVCSKCRSTMKVQVFKNVTNYRQELVTECDKVLAYFEPGVPR